MLEGVTPANSQSNKNRTPVYTVLKIGLIGRLTGRLILFSGSPLNITLIVLIMRSSD